MTSEPPSHIERESNMKERKAMTVRQEAEHTRHAYMWLHEHCDLENDSDWLAYSVLRTALGAFELLVEAENGGPNIIWMD
jgi:hypothetical protein